MNAALLILLFTGMLTLAVGTFCALIGPPEAAEALLGIGAMFFIPAFLWLLGRELDERKITNV